MESQRHFTLLRPRYESQSCRTSRSQAEVFGTFPGGYDLQVTHPPYPVDPKTARAAWLPQLAGFTPMPIPEKLMPASGRRLSPGAAAGRT